MSQILSIFDSKKLFEGITPIEPIFFLPSFDEAKEYQYSGMIDWLTLKIDLSYLTDSDIKKVRAISGHLVKFSPYGEPEWEVFTRQSIKSDSHQVTVHAGADLTICGSPARLGLRNNVFGSLDIQYCATKMIEYIALELDLKHLPELAKWRCTRVDITRNYLMQSGAEARQALDHLKQSPERRQEHSFRKNTLKIGEGSSLHQGKAYLKGQDARRNQRSGKAVYTDKQLLQADRLLRFEYQLCRLKIYELRDEKGVQWHQLTPELLLEMHQEYFKEYLSTVEVADMGNLMEKLLDVAPSEGRAKSAYNCYRTIRLEGFSQAKASYPAST